MSGADIQVEKGNFTRIHNAILEHIARFNFTAREYKAILCLLRMTYGYRTTTAKISGAEWETGTGTKRQNIMPVVASLVQRNIIIQTGGGRGRGNVATYKFNKYSETWDKPENESPSMQLKMNPRRFILDKENESPSMQENESPSMQCTSGLKKRKKAAAEKERETAAAAAPDSPPLQASPFVAAYQQIWGLLVPSPYVAEQILDWEQRVTLDAWEYGLRECVNHNKIGKLNYLTSILSRVEREGLGSPNGNETTTLDFAMEDVS